MNAISRRFELDKYNGKLMGVCAGLGNRTGTDPLWWRIGSVVGTIVGLWFIPILYVLVGWLAQPSGSGTDA